MNEGDNCGSTETSFLGVDSPNDLRMSFIMEGCSNSSWDDLFPANAGEGWRPGPVTFQNSPDDQMTCDRRRSYFHRPVAGRLLGDDVRRHMIIGYPHQLPPIILADGSALQIGALEVLKVGRHSAGRLSFFLVIHARDPDNAGIFITSRFGEGGISSLRDALEGLIREESRDRSSDSLLCCSTYRDLYPRVFTLAWVPYRRASSFLSSSASGGAPDGSSTEEQEVGIQDGLMLLPIESELRTDIIDSHRFGERLSREHCAVLGWQMAWMPLSDSPEFGDCIAEEVVASTHMLSQSWSMTVHEHAVAYIQRQEDGWEGKARLHAFSTHLDVYLLILLARVRVKTLSRRLGEVAEELRDLFPGGAEDSPSHAVLDLDRAIDQAIALDSEAVVFLAGEWWTDVTDNQQCDRILDWMQDTGSLERSVQQVVDQVHQVRESVQNLLERQEQRIEAERQRSTRVIERALAMLTVVGIPLTVLLEIWINRDPLLNLRLTGTASWAWFAGGLLVVVLGSLLLGELLARALFKESLRSLLRHGRSVEQRRDRR